MNSYNNSNNALIFNPNVRLWDVGMFDCFMINRGYNVRLQCLNRSLCLYSYNNIKYRDTLGVEMDCCESIVCLEVFE